MLELKNVSFAVTEDNGKTKTIVNDVSFTLEDGKFAVIHDGTLSRVGGTTWLLPENDDTETYQPIDGTHAELLGKVIAVVRRY